MVVDLDLCKSRLSSTLNHQATNDIMSYNSFNKITTHKFNKDLIV